MGGRAKHRRERARHCGERRSGQGAERTRRKGRWRPRDPRARRAAPISSHTRDRVHTAADKFSSPRSAVRPRATRVEIQAAAPHGRGPAPWYGIGVGERDGRRRARRHRRACTCHPPRGRGPASTSAQTRLPGCSDRTSSAVRSEGRRRQQHGRGRDAGAASAQRPPSASSSRTAANSGGGRPAARRRGGAHAGPSGAQCGREQRHARAKDDGDDGNGRGSGLRPGGAEGGLTGVGTVRAASPPRPLTDWGKRPLACLENKVPARAE